MMVVGRKLPPLTFFLDLCIDQKQGMGTASTTFGWYDHQGGMIAEFMISCISALPFSAAFGWIPGPLYFQNCIRGSEIAMISQRMMHASSSLG